MPADWTAPTSTWQPGAIIEDAHTLDVSADTPPGIYEVEIGLYLNPGDGTFPASARGHARRRHGGRLCLSQPRARAAA